MTLADYSMTAFALLNGGRVIAYMPQIVCVYRDPNGAVAVSLLTWIMFTAANLATVSYALTVSRRPASSPACSHSTRSAA